MGLFEKDKVLVLLVEFSDFKHNNIDQEPGIYVFYATLIVNIIKKCYLVMSHLRYLMDRRLIHLNNIMKNNLAEATLVDGTVTEWLTVPGKASDYGADAGTGHDNKGPLGPKDFVKEALKAAVAKGINLADYDQFDQYDQDGDGNKNEPDGIIDHLMVVHAGVGQEAGGGKLKDDAIWSHRSKLGSKPYAIDGTNLLFRTSGRKDGSIRLYNRA
ncbi:immune inhibitor A domain-containing protein [Bacillus paranthracis]